MNVWDILGIDPTDNQRAIKRAYSKRIAVCHPEDHPEEFQELQKAYELALAYARGEVSLEEFAEDGADDFAEANHEELIEEGEEEEISEPEPVRPEKTVNRVIFDYEPLLGNEAKAEPSTGSNTFSFIGEHLKQEAGKEQERLDAIEAELQRLQVLIDYNADLKDFFRNGFYRRYKDVEGFEERLAEILEPHVNAMNLMELPDLQEAIGYEEDSGGPLDVMFTEIYVATTPLSFVKNLFGFMKKA